jgi:hypothetical protein
MHFGPREIDRRPFKIADLRGPEAVPVCHKKHGGIAQTVAISFGRLD